MCFYFFPGVRDWRSIYRYVIHFIFTEVGSELHVIDQSTAHIYTAANLSEIWQDWKLKKKKRRDASQNFSISANLVEINTAAWYWSMYDFHMQLYMDCMCSISCERNDKHYVIWKNHFILKKVVNRTFFRYL